MANLLLIEDDPAVAEAIMFVIEQHGHQIVHVAGLTRAREVLAENKFDTVLVDVWLAGEDGITFLQEAEKASLPAIVISGGGPGRSLETVTARADANGAVAVLYKPFQDDELMAAINKALAS